MLISSSVADPVCFSRIRMFSIPDPKFFQPGSASKNLSILTPKNWFLSSWKYSRVIHPGSGSRFLPVRIGGSKRHWIPDPQHWLQVIYFAFRIPSVTVATVSRGGGAPVRPLLGPAAPPRPLLSATAPAPPPRPLMGATAPPATSLSFPARPPLITPQVGAHIPCVGTRFVDPDRVGNASFCRIRMAIGIQGKLILSGSVWSWSLLIPSKLQSW
jgi:hypothetical protein